MRHRTRGSGTRFNFINGHSVSNTYRPGDYKLALSGLEHLRQARESFKQAGAVKVVERIDAALRSVGGAIRHRRWAGQLESEAR